MKKTKIIIPSLGLLLLSTAASVTGTVAWFAANASVEATGMQITAKTDSEFLVISKTSDLTANAGSVSLAAPTGQVLPTNWRDTNGADANGWSWVTGAGTTTSNGAINGTGYTNLSIVEGSNFGTANSKNYYVYDTVYVGLAVGSSTPSSSKKLKCNATFTATQASDLNKCLTIGLDVEDNMAQAADLDERLVMGVGTTAATTVNGSSVLLDGDQLSTTAKAIKIYAFFNGDDTNCTTANAVSLAGITVNLQFELA